MCEISRYGNPCGRGPRWARGLGGLALVFGVLIGPATGEPPREIREVSVASGGEELAATVWLPAATRPSPGVVLLHGSGPSTRDMQRPLAEWFVARGVAVLSFDKRGCGDSSGDWTRSSLDDLAGDAMAALDALRAQPEVAEPVGLFGHSQAGWVIPRAVALGARPAFAIVVAGGGARPRTVETYGYRRAFERAGLSADQRVRGFDWVRRYMGYLESCSDRRSLAEGLERERREDWYEQAPLGSILVSEDDCPAWSWVATYDPLPDIERLRFPLLVLFGGADPFAPSEISVARWREGLLEAGNTVAEVEMFPGLGHDLGLGPRRHAVDGGPPQSPSPGASGDSYLDRIERWLRESRVGPP